MIKISYFDVSAHSLPGGRDFLLRFVVQRDEANRLVDHYYEYGLMNGGSLALFHSLWSTDAESLVERMPISFQFTASMDVKQFIRNDREDALAGSLMADDVELLFSQHALTLSRQAA